MKFHNLYAFETRPSVKRGMIKIPKKLFLLFVIIFINKLSLLGQYCIPSISGASNNIGISNVTFNTINCNTPTEQGYLDTTELSTTVIKLETYTLYITVGYTFQDAVIWIDWNQDGDFEDLDETNIVYKLSAGSQSIDIVIPSHAVLGTTRMRIASDNHGFGTIGINNPCIIPQIRGDIEDYTLVIRENPMQMDSIVVIQHEQYDATPGGTNHPVLAIKISTRYTGSPLTLEELKLSTTGTTIPLIDISKARVWNTENYSLRYKIGQNQFGTDIDKPNGEFVISDSHELSPGDNFFWLVYDLSDSACTCHQLDASLLDVTINAIVYSADILRVNGYSKITNNYFPNPDFEYYESIPCGSSGSEDITNYWEYFNGPTAWYDPTTATPDYYSSLSLCPTNQTPNFSLGVEPAYNGEAYMGIANWFSADTSANWDAREFIATRLSRPLKVGRTYNLTFQVSKADYFIYANDIHVMLSVGPTIISLEDRNKIQSTGKASTQLFGTPSFTFSGFAVTINGWTSISYDFIADQAYDHFTIGNIMDSANSNISPIPSGGGTYKSYYIFDAFELYEDPMPNIDTPVATISFNNICLGNTAYFNSDTTSIVDYSFWDFGDLQITSDTSLNQNTTYLYTDTGSYVVTHIVERCCTFDTIYDIIKVYSNPIISLGPDTTICFNETYILDAANIGSDYFWWDGDTVQIKIPDFTSIYIVTVTDSNNCNNVDSVDIVVIPPINLIVSKDMTICNDENITLQASGAINYKWFNAGNLIESGVNSVFIEAVEDIIVQVIGTDKCSTDTSNVDIKVLDCEIFIPNAFSPNGDGENDMFKIRGEGIADIAIKIFNRWGHIVFETTNINEGWNGQGSNKGIYVYAIDGILIANNKKFNKKGNLTLVR